MQALQYIHSNMSRNGGNCWHGCRGNRCFGMKDLSQPNPSDLQAYFVYRTGPSILNETYFLQGFDSLSPVIEVLVFIPT